MSGKARNQIAWVVAALTLGASSMAQSIEVAHCDVLETSDSIEIRNHPAQLQAVQALPHSQHSTTGLHRPATSIVGGNELRQAIAMTAPVQATLYIDQPDMAAALPAAYTLDTLPATEAANIGLHRVSTTTVVIVGFSGWASSDRTLRCSDQLQPALADEGMAVANEVNLNRSIAGWTAPIERRNAVMRGVTQPNMPAQAMTWSW